MLPYQKFSRSALLIGASVLLTISVALASPANSVLTWFASRPLSQQTPWEAPDARSPNELIRQAYVLGELSNRAYSNSASGRNLAELGFKDVAFFDHEADVEAGELGTFVGVNAGAVVGGAVAGSVGSLVGGIIGGAKMSKQKVTSAAFVADSLDGSVRVVAVRGSADLPDWIVDANAATIYEDGVTYHHGFFIYAGLLLDDVLKATEGACAPGGQKLWLTGHSLGGAAAELLAFWLARRGCDVEGVMTFGAPLPGRDDLQYAYNRLLGDVTHHFIHEQDPVGCLPLGLDWAQLGHQHSFSNSGMRLDDPRDLCTGGGDTIAGRALQFTVKLATASDPSTDVAVWMETAAREAGLCPESKTGRIGLGILTLGASEVTCKSIDLAADLAVLKDQLVRLHNAALNNSNPLKHYMDCSYLDRIVETGFDLWTFSDPIWEQRLEASWHLADCTPPPGRQPPTPLGSVCCEAHTDGRCLLWAPAGGCP